MTIRLPQNMLIGLLIISSSLLGSVIEIPTDYVSIQAGIDEAINGDTILVQPGTYIENINFNGKNIVVGSLMMTMGDTSYISQTIIDGSHSGSVVSMITGEDSSAGLYGFTIQNGYASGAWPEFAGGGVRIENSSPTLNYLVISNNEAMHGGGISLAYDSNSLLQNLTIQNNTAHYGAGISALQFSNPNIFNTKIVENLCTGLGGGIRVAMGSTLSIERSLISENRANVGGGIYLFGATEENHVSISITNVTLVNNSTINYAGAIGDDGHANTVVQNSIFWNNVGESQPDILNGIQLSGTAEFGYSAIEGGHPGAGNISDYPSFIDSSSGNFHLRIDSPCIDSGDPDLNNNGTTWETDPDDQDPDGTRMDLGAYYYHQEPEYVGPVWHVLAEGSDETGDGSISSPYATIQTAINASEDSDTVLVWPGTYFENINLNGKNIVVGSLFLTTGDTSYISSTTIDGGATSSVVSFISGETEDCILTGFTVRNGYSRDSDGMNNGYGGGICIRNSSEPIISNLIVENNQSQWEGGGIFIESSNPIIRNSIIRGNIGCGIASISLSSPLIEDCTISGNTSEWGAGITIAGDGSNVDIIRAIIRDNIASQYGGGLYASGTQANPSIVSLINVTVSNNEATNSIGGGILGAMYAEINVVNTILWGNLPDQISQDHPSSIVNVSYSDVQGGHIGEGNINSDPLFENTIGELSLFSPCIDAADPDLDGDGDHWVIDTDDRDPDGTRMDMGASYYHHTIPIYLGPVWYVSTEGSDETGNGSTDLPFASIQFGINVAQNGDTVLVNPGNYFENLNITEKSIALGSLSLVTGDSSFTWQTTIQGGGSTSGSVISIVGSSLEPNSSLVHGFNIVNGGSSWFDGGISCQADATIERNLIHSNNRNGITVIGEYNPTIRFNAIHNNSSHGIHLDTSVDTSTHIYLNRIFENTFDGIYCQTQASPSIIDNIITDNGRHGFNIITQSNPTIRNNIIWGNVVSSFAFSDPPNAPTLSYNCIEGGFPESGFDNGNNISGDPLFCDLEWGNFSVDDDSPLIGVGPQGTNIGAAQIGCDLFYLGPVWHISTQGSDTLGDGSYESPFGSIQAGIDYSSNGDTILVQPGSYVEDINFLDKSIVVGSQYLSTGDTSFVNSTIIDGMVRIEAGVDSSALFTGFTIQSGSYGVLCYGDPTISHVKVMGAALGGIFFSDANATLMHSIISGNTRGVRLSTSDVSISNTTISLNGGPTSTGNGVGTYSYSSSVRFDSCTIADNHTSGVGGGVRLLNSIASISNSTISRNEALNGGGVYCDGSTSLVLDGVAINSNQVDGDGGGLYLATNGTSLLATNSQFNDNISGVNGGGIYSESSPGFHLYNHCSIQRNTASVSGGGIYLWGSSPILTNVLITDNEASGIEGTYEGGGGIYVRSDATNPTFNNATIANNYAVGNGGGIFNLGGAHPEFTNTIIYHNVPNSLNSISGTAPTYCDIEGDLIGDSSINMDPLFVDMNNGDYHLSDTSPCIDTANPDSDGDGNNWDVDPDDQDPDGTRMDMGAYYFHQQPAYSGPKWFVSTEGSNTTGDGSEVSPYQTISKGIYESSNFDTVIVLPGTYYESVDFSGKFIVLGSLYLLSQDTSYISSTIIDGSGADRVVTFNNSENNVNTRLSGFTIQNGYTHSPGEYPNGYGGGIFVGQNCSPTLDHLVVKDCYAQYTGGGIQSEGSPRLKNLRVHDNQSETNGGGVFVTYFSWTTIENTIIHNNTSTTGGGVGITSGGSNAFLTNCLIYNNTASIYGGGIYLSSGSLSLTNCTVTDNTLSNPGTGGGLYNLSGSATISNTIIFGNNPGPTVGTGEFNASYSCTSPVLDGDGNINANPLFVSSESHNYSLSDISPCIDAGDPDLDGDGNDWTIDIDDQDPDGTRMDIGAEYFNHNMGNSFEVSGLITSDQIWNADTVLVVGDVTIDSLVSLTIIQGTLVEFQGAFDITVNGTILAEGTNESPIIFDSNHLGLGWHGIRYWLSPLESDSSKFIYCEFRNGYAPDAGGHPDNSGGAILSQGFGKIYISHCLFEDNTVYGEGGAIKLHEAGIVIVDSEFRNNHSYNSGGAIWSQYSDITLQRNTFYGNVASSSGGALVLTNTSDAIIENNTFVNNSAQWGGAILFVNLIDIELKNCIIWDNPSPNGQIRLDSDLADPGFSYCDIQGGISSFSYNGTYTGSFENNLDLNPLFMDQVGGIIDLTVDSPCIDSGDPDFDDDGTTWELDSDDQDPDGTRMDIGAYYYHQDTTANGSSWYVSIDGSDGDGDGTLELPYQTIQQAVSVSSIQDTVILLPGNYEIESPIEFPEFPITIKSSEGFVTTSISGSQYPVLLNNTIPAVCLSTIQDITFEGFIHIAQSSQYLPRFDNCKFSNNLYSGGGLFDLAASDSTVQFEHCIFALNTTGSDLDGLFTGASFHVNFTNCSFAWNANGIFRIDYGGVTFNNCILRTSLGAINQTSKQANYSFIEYPDEFNFSSMYECIEGGTPGFSAEEDGILRLVPQSICIDRGNPEQFDPDGTRSDMGALYFDQDTSYVGSRWHVDPTGDDWQGSGDFDNPFVSILQADNFASPGDTVILFDGSHSQVIRTRTPSIVFTSMFMFSGDSSHIANTILDGEFIRVPIEVSQASIEINGITIQNGFCNGGALCAGGVYLNSATENARITNCRIIGNGTGDEVTLAGGGILSFSPSLEISNCLFENNYAYAAGGALGVRYPGVVNINNSEFVNNHSNGTGGAIKATYGELYIDKSLFYGNYSGGNGQVIHADDQSDVAINFSTLSDNGDLSGSITLADRSTLTLSNSIVWGTPNYQVVILDVGDTCSVDISYSDFDNGILGIDDQSGDLLLDWGSGNINQLPEFVSASDLALQATSPCIDTADPDSPMDPDGTRADMGALPFSQEETHPLPPQNLSAIPGIQQITLIWNANSENNISKYLIFSDTSPSPIQIIDSTQSFDDTTKTVAGLTNGEIYYFRIAAVNDIGNMSDYSNEIMVSPVQHFVIWTDGDNGVTKAYDYNTNTWTPLSSPGPAYGSFIAMAYDIESDRVIWINGNGPVAKAYDFNNDNWESISHPEADNGVGFGITYDIESDRVIWASGNNGHAKAYDYNTDTWEVIQGPGTSNGQDIAMAYDIESDMVIWTEGDNGVTKAYDYNTNTWTLLSSPGNANGSFLDMAYDIESDRVIWVKGDDGDARAYDFNNDNWESISHPEADNGVGFGITYDIESDRVIWAKGDNGHAKAYDYNTDTWEDIQGPGTSNGQDIALTYRGVYNPATLYDGPVWYVSTDGSDELGSGTPSAPFASIQKAAMEASSGDTIQVGEGLFTDPINIQDESLYLIGVDSTQSIIAADYIYCQSHESSIDVSFKNLRFESIVTGSHTMIWSECTNCTEDDSITVEFVNVYGDGSAEKSFMVASTRSVVEVYNSQFNSFSRGNYGGVFDLERANSNSTLRIVNSVFLDNVADRGGAIHLENGNSLYINQSEFTDNYATRNDQGGGAIFLSSDCRADISSTRFLNNSTLGSGGAINSAESDIHLNLCSFNQNSAGGQGQALHVYGPGHCVLTRSTIGTNGSTPGSVSLQTGVNFEVDNSILWGNPNFQIVVLNSAIACTVAVEYTDLSNGILGIDDQSGSLILNWSDGNINTSPEFNSIDDLTLQVSSPCIDAGDTDSDGDGDTWELDTDDQDPDGTRLDMGAFYFNQTDTIAPQVHLNYPEIIAEPQNGDTLLISWIASDNIQLSWAKLWFSSDGGQSFMLSDSIDANWGQVEWIVPDVISNSCKLAIWVSDLAGNVSADTLAGTFPIDDGTPPTISVLTPTISSTIPERDTLLVTWEAADNVGIEWFDLYYYNHPGGLETSSFNIPASERSFSFVIPTPGVTDSAQIRIEVQDLAANTNYDYSDYFSVTDNTRPRISHFSIPDTTDWGIGSIMDIGVIATDNVEITGLDLNYSTDNGSNWLPIVGDLYPVQGRPTYSWLIPDIPGECQIQAVVSDAVGLTDTSYSEVFTIYVAYPRMIASLPSIRPDGDMHLRFSQRMDSLEISSGTQVTGSVHGPYEISGLLNGDDLIITATEGFVSLDTLQVVLTSSLWTNSFGYGLDGNGNGAYDGNSVDNDTSYTIITAAGDYDQNGVLNFDDFDDFVIAWNNDVFEYELAPHQGDIPFINIQPDSSFDIFDLATFASMWNWAAGMSLSPPLTESFQYEEFVSEQKGNDLSVLLPRSQYLASQTIIKYDPNQVEVRVADHGLAKVSSSALSFVDVNPDSGFILITSSHLNESNEDELNLTLIPSTKQKYSIEVAFQGSDIDANVAQKRSLVELLPIPTRFSLSQNYPNPFNANTTIEYGLPKDSDLSISIYDIRGRFVRNIYSGEKQAGYHVTQWNGTSDGGQNVASGLYFIVLHTPEYRVARKALILK